MPSTRPGRLAGNMGDLDAVVVLNATEPFLDSAYWYLTGCSSGTFEGARAVVLSDGSLHVFVSVLEEEAASAGAGEVHVYGTDRERKEMMAEGDDGGGAPRSTEGGGQLPLRRLRVRGVAEGSHRRRRIGRLRGHIGDDGRQG